jgi:hypothetical protein
MTLKKYLAQPHGMPLFARSETAEIPISSAIQLYNLPPYPKAHAAASSAVAEAQQ